MVFPQWVMMKWLRSPLEPLCIVLSGTSLWRKRAHTLATLIKLCFTMVKCKFTEEDHNSFTEINKIVGIDVIISQPNFSGYFMIHAYSRKSQMGE